jgi:hypothetical protein
MEALKEFGLTPGILLGQVGILALLFVLPLYASITTCSADGCRSKLLLIWLLPVIGPIYALMKSDPKSTK